MKSLQQIVSDERRATAPERRVAKADPEKLRAGVEKLAAACIRALAELKAHGLAPGNRDQLGIARALIEAGVEVEQTPDPMSRQFLQDDQMQAAASRSVGVDMAGSEESATVVQTYPQHQEPDDKTAGKGCLPAYVPGTFGNIEPHDRHIEEVIDSGQQFSNVEPYDNA